MSARELNRTFPKNDANLTSKNISRAISKAIKKAYSKKHGSIKYLSNLTSHNPRALYNWSNGLNCPDLLNFIILAKNIPTIFDLFVMLCERDDIFKIENLFSEKNTYKITNTISGKIYSLIQNEGINFFEENFQKISLNRRQHWFVNQIKKGKNTKNNDLVAKFNISKATAERDISKLLNLKIIEFVGSKKNGMYVIKKI